MIITSISIYCKQHILCKIAPLIIAIMAYMKSDLASCFSLCPFITINKLIWKDYWGAHNWIQRRRVTKATTCITDSVCLRFRQPKIIVY